MRALLPPNNRPAGRAYVCAMFGLIPALGVVLGPLAIASGCVGLRRQWRDPKAQGFGHAVVGIALGAIEFPTHSAGLAFIAIGLGWV